MPCHADPNIYARHIDVSVNCGVVHLGGYVWENEDHQAARRDATSVDGVKAVDMEMQRRQPSPYQRIRERAWELIQ